jgi:hypothetical protein
MSDDDALVGDMHPQPGFFEVTPSILDEDLVERLLAGRLDPVDAPAGYGGLVRLLDAATAPATAEELAGEQVVLAEFAAVMRSDPPTLVRRRAAMPSKVFRVKAAAAVLAAALSIGGVAAAATGLLPSQARQANDQAPSTTAAGHELGQAAVADLGQTAKQGLCQAWQAGKGADNGRREDSPVFQALAAAAGSGDNIAAYCNDNTALGGSADRQGQATASGPDAMAAARAGLCRAWQAGQDADNGRREDSVAFQALAAVAGGADRIAAFCQGTTAGSAGADGQGSPPSGSPASTKVPPPSTDSPPSTVPGGNGQGGPPTSG